MGCCFCCCGTPRRVCCCLSTLVLVIVGVILLCVFLVPRHPTVCLSVAYPEDFSASASGISVIVPVNVSVANPNYFGVTVHDVTIYLDYNVRSLTGTSMTSVAEFDSAFFEVKRRANSTNLVLVNFETSANTTQANTNILADCTASGTTDLYVRAILSVREHIITVPDQQVAVKCSIVSTVAGSAAVLVQTTQSNSTTSSCSS